MGGGKRKLPEGGVRINFLHQARHQVLSTVAGTLGRLMAASLGQHMVAIGKKSQVRLSPRIKETLCKVSRSVRGECLSSCRQGCGGLLVPAVSADVKLALINRKERIIQLTCKTCLTQKKIFIKPKQKKEIKRS